MIEPIDIGYAKTLKKLRTDSKKIQYEVALDLNLHDQRVLSEYESGKRHFTEGLIEKIGFLFKISRDEFQKLAEKLSDKGIRGSAHVKVGSLKSSGEEEKLKLLLYLKRNLELQLDKLRLERELIEVRSKLKAWPSNPDSKTIYVVI